MTPQTDEALIREIRSDRDASPREKELARRMLRLLFAFDALEELMTSEDISVETERLH